MDPDKCLEELLTACEQFTNALTRRDAISAAEAMRDRTTELDEWLHNGGFMPNRWAWPDIGQKE